MSAKLSVVILVFCSFAAISGASENYILQRDIGDKYSLKVDAEDVMVYPDHILDTIKLNKRIESRQYRHTDLPEVIESTIDTSALVLRIDSEWKGEMEGEYHFSLFGEIIDKRFTKLYLRVGGQGVDYWRLTESACEVEFDSMSGRVSLSAVMKAIGFPAASPIRGPLNDTGWYDYDIERYMLIESSFSIGDDMIKYFPKAYEP